ncbi:hypothetical protein AMAG_17763 [Allomyces macrogynus ATCC 38327]|uniref:Protein Asterix n=1 Tax=Allomyces macrogynus (strain ATCC 38327) TaxID=578462 RepID=A0A0L0RY31_ALLM3|nr:hypothetical protein AMAG_17763 [Allomyces macrogynus ATCC 38327]|eukprot:KNE55268.1 hypothetical protein AMAG_17763 [Allomyces macrogynus ATCC 38327]
MMSEFPRFDVRGDPRREDLVIPTAIEKPKKEEIAFDYFQGAALMIAIGSLMLRFHYTAWLSFFCCLFAQMRRKVSEQEAGLHSGQIWSMSILSLIMSYTTR